MSEEGQLQGGGPAKTSIASAAPITGTTPPGDAPTAGTSGESVLPTGEAWLRTMFEQAPVGVSHFALDGQTLHANPRLCEMLGYTREELLGLTYLDVTHPEDRAENVEGVRKLITGEADTFAMEKRGLRKDGSLIWLELTLSLLRDAQGAPEAIVGITVDITKRKRIEQELATHAGQLEAIVEAITDGVTVTDRMGHVTLRNSALRRMLPASEFPGFDEARPPAERGALYLPRDAQGEPMSEEAWPVTRVLRGETLTGPNSVDMLMRTPDGRDLALNITGAPVRDAAGRILGGVTVSRDVTVRRRLERRANEALNALLALAEHLVGPPERSVAPGHGRDEARLGARIAELTRSVLDCYRVALVFFDPRSGRLNPLAYACQDDESEPEWWESIRHATIRDQLTPRDIERFLAGEAFVMDTAAAPYAERPHRSLARSVLLIPLCIEGRILGGLSVDHGAQTHTYTVEELELASAAAQLIGLLLERERLVGEREAERGRASALEEANHRLDEFMGIASHELRTPITSARLNVQFALRLLAGTETLDAAAIGRLRQSLMIASHALDRQNRLIGDLLDAARVRTGRLELKVARVDLAAIVHEAVEEQRLAAPERVLTLETPDRTVPVLADGDRIAQVVANYLTNALKYSPEEAPVAVCLRVEARRARVSVRDAGPGLPREERRRIWERFHRAEAVAPVRSGSGVGLGLGLYISRELIQRHGGRVGLRSTPGKGSTFWFTLPLSEGGEG